MGGIDFELTGVGELETLTANLEHTGRNIRSAAARVVRRNAALVESYAKQFAPVDTGALRNSIDTRLTSDGKSGETSANIGTDIHYGGFVERGTSRAAPRAFLGPAFDRVQPDFTADCAALANSLDV